MGFEKKEWKDRVSEYPNRRALTKADGSTEEVFVSRNEGLVAEEGDAFSADNMNGLEERVGEALSVLSAADGTEFRFGVNEKGEYGYIVTKDGADTVIPFSNKAMIVAALQYSGLGITEDSTWDEIYAKLAAAYPEILVLWDGVTNLLEPLIYYSGQGANDDYRVVGDWSIYTYNNLNSYRCTYTVLKDISLFKKVTFTYDRHNVNQFSVGEIYIGIGKNQNTPDAFYKLENGGNMTGTVELDISELSGNYYIGIFVYMPEDEGSKVGVTTSIKNITLTV